jgi:hypothetical protein
VDSGVVVVAEGDGDKGAYRPRGRSRSPSPEVPVGEYEVEEIWEYGKGSSGEPGYYYVKWKGYDECDNTWEPSKFLFYDKVV